MGLINANVGAGLSQGYSQSANSGGAVNSAENYSNYANSSWNESYQDAFNEGWSNAQSMTDAMTARKWSEKMADKAWERSMEAFEKEMEFNRTEAEKQRNWQADMANTIYTRSAKNMKEAGINPILAYNMGLSGASVGSGATASLGGSPSAPLAQNFMDSWSASESYNHGSSHGESHGGSEGWGFGEGWSDGSSWNSGWSNSEEGIVTALQGLSGMADSALNLLNSGNTMAGITSALGGNGDAIGKTIGNAVKQVAMNPIEKMADRIQNKLNDHRKDNSKSLGGGGNAVNKKFKR